MKCVLTVVLFFITLISVGQSYSIDTIAEKSPYFPGDIYRFPILKGADKEICKKINSHLINDFLHIDHGTQQKSIFENVWGTDDDPYPSVSELTFEADIFNSTYSLTFKGEWCGAYCEGFSKSYNYELKSGIYIEIDTLVSPKSKVIVLQYLSMVKRNKILRQINYLNKNLKSDSLNDDMQYHTKEARQMYENCLSYSVYNSFEYFNYRIKNDSIILRSGRCSNHIDQPLDDLWYFIYEFKISEIKKYLSLYGKEILV